MIKQKIEEINVLITYFSYILNMMKEEMGSENVSVMQVGTGLTYVPRTVHLRHLQNVFSFECHIFR